MSLFLFYFINFFHENYFIFSCSGMFRNVPECSVFWVLSTPYMSCLRAVRRLLFPSLHAEKGRLRNTVANCVPAPRWRGILFRINHEIRVDRPNTTHKLVIMRNVTLRVCLNRGFSSFLSRAKVTSTTQCM